MRLKVWILVDLGYQPRPIVVDASASREAMIQEARERNGSLSRVRFKVFTASAEVSLAGLGARR